MATEAEEAEAQAASEKAEEEESKAQEEESQHEEEDERRDPGSTMVQSWAYNGEAEELEVEFVNGHEESYPCTPEQWAEASSASSAGKWMHSNML